MTTHDDPIETATLYDERTVVANVARRCGIGPLMAGEILAYIEGAALENGKTFHHHVTPRWNADGDRIGPDSTLDTFSVYYYAFAVEAVADALEAAVANMLQPEVAT